jgi:hypothetical protein
MAVGALIAVLILGGGGFFVAKQAMGGSAKATATPVVAGTPKMTLSGTKSGGQFANGSSVTIKLAAQNADAYRLVVAKNSEFVKAQTFELVEPQKSLSVLGATTYYIKSQAKRNGKWGPMSSVVSFNVAQPAVGKTRFLSPANGLSTFRTAIHLAWAPVAHAVGYKLGIDGHSRTVSGTSTTISARVGRHHVSVAALVKGARVYSGPVAALSFTVRVRPKPTAVPTAAPVSPPSSGSGSTGSGSTGTGSSGTGSSGTGSSGSGTTYNPPPSSGSSGSGTTYNPPPSSGSSGSGSSGSGSSGSGSSGSGSNPCAVSC